MRKDDFGLQRDEFLGYSLHCLRIFGYRPALVDSEVVTFRPAQRPKFFANRRGPSLRFRIALGAPNQHANSTYPLCLLRARNQRETSCAAE